MINKYVNVHSMLDSCMFAFISKLWDKFKFENLEYGQKREKNTHDMITIINNINSDNRR
jgi:hypothetical protein